MTGISREQLDDDLKWHSDAVSKGVRTIAFAAIAGVWAVMTADRLSIGPSGLFGIPTSLLVTWTFVLASTTLLVDIVQYVAAYLMTDIGIDRWEADEDADNVEFAYTEDRLGKWGMRWYRVNYVALRAKLATAILAGLLFVLFAFAIRFG